jgi:hypothetical protein
MNSRLVNDLRFSHLNLADRIWLLIWEIVICHFIPPLRVADGRKFLDELFYKVPVGKNVDTIEVLTRCECERFDQFSQITRLFPSYAI